MITSISTISGSLTSTTEVPLTGSSAISASNALSASYSIMATSSSYVIATSTGSYTPVAIGQYTITSLFTIASGTSNATLTGWTATGYNTPGAYTLINTNSEARVATAGYYKVYFNTRITGQSAGYAYFDFYINGSAINAAVNATISDGAPGASSYGSALNYIYTATGTTSFNYGLPMYRILKLAANDRVSIRMVAKTTGALYLPGDSSFTGKDSITRFIIEKLR